MEQKTIYLVTSGQYSEYHVDAVFDNAEMADEFVRKFSRSDSYNGAMRVDEYPLNPDVPSLRAGLFPFLVVMERDGTTSELLRMDVADEDEWYYNERYVGGTVAQKLQWNWLETRCYAENEQHAVKIANEHRVQLIANGEWK